MIRKTTDLQNRAIRSPVVLGLAGATLGVVAAKMIRGATAGRHAERVEWYDEELEGYDAADDLGVADRAHPSRMAGMKEKAADMADGVKGKASDMVEGVKDRAADLKDRAVDMKDRAMHAAGDVKRAAGERAAHLRDRMPSMDSLRERGGRAVGYATEEQPAIGALLALGIGVALGMLLPVTEVEEKALAPVMDRAAENLGHLEAKVRELTEKLDEKIAGERRDEGASVSVTPPVWPTTPV